MIGTLHVVGWAVTVSTAKRNQNGGVVVLSVERQTCSYNTFIRNSVQRTKKRKKNAKNTHYIYLQHDTVSDPIPCNRVELFNTAEVKESPSDTR